MKVLLVMFFIFSFIAILVTTIILIIVFTPEQSEEYESTTYYKTTLNPYNITHNDKGTYGEYLIYKYLETFENIGSRFLFNLYIPIPGNKTTEIDLILITKKGIYVFESKNYSGYIFGNVNAHYWYQTLHVGKGKIEKNKFYNPIKQNANHIKYLKKVVGEKLPLHSIIVFSERCEFKSINNNIKNVEVIKRNEVYNTIFDKEESFISVLNQQDIENIYNTLLKYTIISDEEKMKHVSNIAK